ncbi:MAG TPA: hypothetical protein PK514_00005 [Spirochaetota bacterium]|nr:hypothetical protein [Spirochaetota bacterium]
MDNRIRQQVELVHIIVSLFEVVDRSGYLFELEKYLYLADNYQYLAEAINMVTKGTDPEEVAKYLKDLVDSEQDPDVKRLKKMVEQAVPQIQIGIGTAYSIKYRLFALVSPEVEHHYTMKLLEFERRKNLFYSESVLFNSEPELVSVVETIFLFGKIAGHPVGMTAIEYRTIALALLGCSRAMQVKIFEYFPLIEAEKFLDFYSPGKINETDVINAMHEIEEWERKQEVLRKKIIEWQLKQNKGE